MKSKCGNSNEVLTCVFIDMCFVVNYLDGVLLLSLNIYVWVTFFGVYLDKR